jgi:transposase
MWQPSKLTSQQMEERRMSAALLLQSGRMSKAQIARHVGVTRKTVSTWARLLSYGGQEALHSRARHGRIPLLDARQWQELLNLLNRGAQALGFPTERWTLARIRDVVLRQFGISYSLGYLSRRLRSLHWSVQKPQPSPKERDDMLVEAWLKGDWPRIKKMLQTDRKGPKTSANCLY